MKKVFSAMLSLMLLLLLTVPAFASAEAEQSNSSLRFNDNGKFKVMYICDVQDIYPMDERTLTLMAEALDNAKPDIVVFGGDNTVCAGEEIYGQLLKPLTDRGIPFTFVFGNHDNESLGTNGGLPTTKEWQLEQYQKYEGCLAYDEVPALHGCATHSLPVYSSDGSKVAFNLWMFDSGDYVTTADGHYYDCVRKDQIDWYTQKSMQLEQENGGKVPSLAFQHIIVKEIYDAVFLKLPVSAGKASRNFTDGSVYSFIPNLFKFDGIMLEAPCPSLDNEGQWDAFAQRSDVLACSFGHDHVNSFRIKYKGIDMLQTPSVTYHSYGDDLIRGVRVYELDENDPWNYETYVLTEAELGRLDGSKLPEVTGDSAFIHTLRYYMCKFLMFLMDIV